MRIDEHEYVCEVCGCIYDIESLVFVDTENDSYTIKDEYDMLIESAILEESGVKIALSTSINISNIKSFIPKPMVTYKCPVCKCTVCMPDRRKSIR